MSNMPSRVIVMALRMASSSHGFLNVRMDLSKGSRLCDSSAGYALSARLVNSTDSLSASAKLSRSMSVHSSSRAAALAALWKRVSNSLRYAMSCMPVSSRASSGFMRRPVQRSACASGGSMNSVSCTSSPCFSAMKMNP